METKELKVGDWVIYRNHSISFDVFDRVGQVTCDFRNAVALKFIDGGSNRRCEKIFCNKITKEEAMLWKLQN